MPYVGNYSKFGLWTARPNRRIGLRAPYSMALITVCVYFLFGNCSILILASSAKEKSRREFIENLWNRDPAKVAEEDILYLELKRLEQTERKFARNRDTLLRNLAGIESGLSGIDIQEDGLVGWGGNPADLPQPKRQGGRNRKSLRGLADLDYEL